MIISVPFLDMKARYQRTAAAVEAAALEALRGGRYVGGPAVDACEAAVAAAMGRARGVGAASGTAALEQALQAAGVGPGSEVIVPAVTFFATAGAVLRIGASPVVVDVLPDRPLLDPGAAAAAVGPRTRAVIPVHLFGDAAPHPDVAVPVIDDAAQAVGADPPVGRGIAAAVSFYPTKILGAYGDGGMVLTDDPALADRARALGCHGMDAEAHLHARTGQAMGGNSRLDAIQAAILLAQLPDLPARAARRRAVAARYDAAFGDLALPRDGGSPVSVYTLLHPRRGDLAAALAAAGVGTALYYPRPLSAQPALAGCAVYPTPNADNFCRRALAIPCHEALDDAAVDAVIAAVRAAA